MEIKRIFSSRNLLIILIVVLAFSIHLFYKQWKIKKGLEQRISNLWEKVEGIEIENEEIEEELLGLEGEEAEELLRRIYVLKKPGEQAIVMPAEMLKEDSLDDISNKKSIWQRIKDMFSRQ